MESITIREIKEQTNYILFSCFNFSIEELKLSNAIFAAVEDYNNGEQ